MNTARAFPSFDSHFTDWNQFILELVKEYKAEKIRSWHALEERVNSYIQQAGHA